MTGDYGERGLSSLVRRIRVVQDSKGSDPHSGTAEPVPASTVIACHGKKLCFFHAVPTLSNPEPFCTTRAAAAQTQQENRRRTISGYDF